MPELTIGGALVALDERKSAASGMRPTDIGGVPVTVDAYRLVLSGLDVDVAELSDAMSRAALVAAMHVSAGADPLIVFKMLLCDSFAAGVLYQQRRGSSDD